MKRNTKAGWGLILTLLPFGFIILLIWWLTKSGFLKNLFDGLGTLSKGFADAAKGGGAAGVDRINTSESQEEKMKQAAKKNKVGVTPIHEGKANELFSLVNETQHMTTTSLNMITQRRILDVIKNNKSIGDRAAIITAYGSRTANNRQSVWLGFVWDETTGSLRDHVSRYFSDASLKKQTLAYIDGAINGYLL